MEDLLSALESGRSWAVVNKVTGRLETAIQQLLTADAAPYDKGPVNAHA